MRHAILMHEADDDVGVAVRDIAAGEEVGAVTLEGQPVGMLNPVDSIPLGHKVSMRGIAQGAPVIEYGRPIGKATRPIAMGSHVHTQNLKTMRWSS
ncbi:MAG: UxaA family hydrolase [Acidobacteriota bacterium]